MSSNVHDIVYESGPDRYISELGVSRTLIGTCPDYRHPSIVSGETFMECLCQYADEVPSIRCSNMMAVPTHVTHGSWRNHQVV